MKYAIKKRHTLTSGTGAGASYPMVTGMSFTTDDEPSTQAVKIALEYRGYIVEAQDEPTEGET